MQNGWRFNDDPLSLSLALCHFFGSFAASVFPFGSRVDASNRETQISKRNVPTGEYQFGQYIYINIYMLNIAEMIHRHVNVSSMLDSQVFIGRHAQGTEYTPHKYIQQCGQLMNMFYD